MIKARSVLANVKLSEWAVSTLTESNIINENKFMFIYIFITLNIYFYKMQAHLESSIAN